MAAAVPAPVVPVPSESKKVSVSGAGKVRSKTRTFSLPGLGLAAGALLLVKVGEEAKATPAKSAAAAEMRSIKGSALLEEEGVIHSREGKTCRNTRARIPEGGSYSYHEARSHSIMIALAGSFFLLQPVNNNILGKHYSPLRSQILLYSR
ncbi:MAG: hypothetical protein WD850_02060 [Candidatus Spechtbacterales bacterium]